MPADVNPRTLRQDGSAVQPRITASTPVRSHPRTSDSAAWTWPFRTTKSSIASTAGSPRQDRHPRRHRGRGDRGARPCGRRHVAAAQPTTRRRF